MNIDDETVLKQELWISILWIYRSACIPGFWNSTRHAHNRSRPLPLLRTPSPPLPPWPRPRVRARLALRIYVCASRDYVIWDSLTFVLYRSCAISGHSNACMHDLKKDYVCSWLGRKVRTLVRRHVATYVCRFVPISSKNWTTVGMHMLRLCDSH